MDERETYETVNFWDAIEDNNRSYSLGRTSKSQTNCTQMQGISIALKKDQWYKEGMLIDLIGVGNLQQGSRINATVGKFVDDGNWKPAKNSISSSTQYFLLLETLSQIIELEDKEITVDSRKVKSYFPLSL